MDLVTRFQYPIVRPSQVISKGANKIYSGGMWLVPINELIIHTDDSYTYIRTGETFCLLTELKKCCRFGASGVYLAFSNVCLSVDVKLEIGRIKRFALSELLPKEFSEDSFVIIGRPLLTAIGRDVQNGEWLFPLVQYSDQKSVNITAAAFADCPPSFSPNTTLSFYLSFRSSDHAIQLLHKSLIEFSQIQPNYAITLLYASIESASTILSGENEGRVTARLQNFANRIKILFPEYSPIMRRIKRQIENRIVRKRGDFAHKGIDLTQEDLLPSYETALEFYWYYAKFKELRDRCSG